MDSGRLLVSFSLGIWVPILLDDAEVCIVMHTYS